MQNITITENGVYKLLRNIKPHKATGPDNIQARYLKELALELTPAITFLFQTSLEQGKLPNDWLQAHIVPVFKKGDKNTASNYRPVSLTSILCKTLEHIVNSSIMKHLDIHKILTDSQHGFRARRSCETQLLETLDDITKRAANNKQIDIILLDFSKAFDKVPHKRLLNKLNYYGIRSNTLQWIYSFLHDRKQLVLLEGVKSSTATVDSGVPQGTVLGPLLFLVYINDLPENLHSSAKLFADDCLLYREVNTTSDTNKLQEDLDMLQKWESKWQMAFNADKCFVIRAGTKRKTIKQDYTIHNHILEVVEESKYLGVTISKDLTWKAHINNITNKANKTLGFIKRNIHGCTQKVKQHTFTTMVRPTLEYASTCWDPHSKDLIEDIEQVQKRAARFVYNNYRSKEPGCVTNMLDTLNWEPLSQRRAKNRVTMLYKIINDQVTIDPNTYLNKSDTRTRGEHKYKQIATSKNIYKSHEKKLGSSGSRTRDLSHPKRESYH